MSRTLAASKIAIIGLGIFTFGIAAPAARAQTDSVTMPAIQPVQLDVVSSSDSLLVLVPVRSRDDIRRELESYATQRATAEADIQYAKALQARAETEIRLKKTQLQTIGANLDLAKKEKNDVAKSEWESKKRLAELEKDLLERRGALRHKEIEFAEAIRDYARAQAEANELELVLAEKREQRAGFGGREATPEVVRASMKADEELDKAQRQTLDAQIKAAEHGRNVATKQVDLAKNRKKVLEAQLKLLRGA